jgi:orotidine-5'-phosphate decarboxylase
LIDTIEYLKKNYPEIPVILDGKFADIENSSKYYAKLAFEKFGADAVTVNPYLGKEGALEPFLERKDKGILILCHTSNPGAKEIQECSVLVLTLYGSFHSVWEYVAHQVVHHWNKNQNCWLVVGATFPEILKRIREIVEDLPLFVPGIGAQRGDLEKTLRYGLDSQSGGLIIHSARKIIYASKRKYFADAAKEAAKSLRDQINILRDRLRS